MDSISLTAYRRFILGCQGLWPGRRWAGKTGTAEALRAAESVQVDPVAVVAQSHDIALWGRVADYRPEYLQELLYQDRQFFDYGGALFIYPVEEFPYWMVEMKRHAAAPHWREYIKENPKLFERVRAEMRRLGVKTNAQFLFGVRYPADAMVAMNADLLAAFRNAGFDCFRVHADGGQEAESR